jgi:hypothetical protein
MLLPLRRRHFRFSLRAFFILMTITCVWLGWNVNQVHQRRQFLQSVNVLGAVRIDPDFKWPKSPTTKRSKQSAKHLNLQGAILGSRWSVRPSVAPRRPGRISKLRQLLGDEQFLLIDLSHEADFERARMLFPEASFNLVRENQGGFFAQRRPPRTLESSSPPARDPKRRHFSNGDITDERLTRRVPVRSCLACPAVSSLGPRCLEPKL